MTQTLGLLAASRMPVLGAYASAPRRYICTCGNRLESSPSPLDWLQVRQLPGWEQDDNCRCPDCGGPLELLVVEPPPSWRDIRRSLPTATTDFPSKALRPPGPGG